MGIAYWNESGNQVHSFWKVSQKLNRFDSGH